VAEQRGDLQAASRYYKEALAADPDYPGASAFLGGVLARLGDTHGAQKALARATSRGEGGVTTKYNQAVVRTKAGDYRGAIPLLVEVIQKDPSLKDAYRLLAAAYRKTNQYEKAAQTSQKLLDKFGPSAGEIYQLAYAQFKSGDYKEAVENYEIVTAMQPDNFNAYYGSGQSLMKLGRYDDAAEAFAKAVKLRPDNEIAVFNLAFAYQKAGRYNEAIDSYLDASDLKETIRSYTNIAICYRKLGDKDAADEYYEKVNAMKKK
jgi:tetratricopeptide (TPR) repeat protein